MEKRSRILQLLQDSNRTHISDGAIARNLTRGGIPCNTRYVQRVRTSRSVTVAVGSGGARYAAISDAGKAAFISSVVGEVDENNFRYGGRSVRQALLLWNDEHKEQVSRTSARRWLAEANYTARVPRTGPFIKLLNVQQRERFVDRHWRHSANWWTNVCFTDSTTVASEHVPNARNERQWCLPGEQARPLRKKSRPAYKIHLYAAITKWGMVGPIYVPDGSPINQYTYTRTYLPALLKGIAAIYERNNDKSRWTFQQDGAKPHTSDRCQGYLGRQENLRWWPKDQWPGASPDLSPVEGMWAILQDYVTPPKLHGHPARRVHVPH